VIELKTCNQCQRDLPLDQFYKRKASKDGHTAACRDCQSQRGKQAYARNREQRLAQAAAYRAGRRDYYRDYCRDYMRERMAEHGKATLAAYHGDARTKLDMTARTVLAQMLRGQIQSSGYFDFTSSQLQRHVEAQFQDGMSWANRKAWAVGPIRPAREFEYQDKQDIGFRKCWRLANIGVRYA